MIESYLLNPDEFNRKTTELIKKEKLEGLTHEEKAELDKLFGETSRKATEDLCQLMLLA